MSADGAGARLVLASRSPQRRAILKTLGVPFLARPTDVPERDRGEPTAVALENALRKARAAAEVGETLRAADGCPVPVLGVDTLVALDGAIYGKPADEAAAALVLRTLSGARHTVISGLALVADGAPPRSALAFTAVRFRRLDDALIAWYLRSGEWQGRAGGYAIQERGAALVEAIDGDYTNVVGLPVAALLELWPGLLGTGP